MSRWAVFLGGHDLEMVEIANLLATREDVTVHDRGLPWGAKASMYLMELQDAIAKSQRVVLVELIDDLPAGFPRDQVTFVDHHGPLAGEDRPTAIEQVFALLGFSPEVWTRDLALVAANDRGHTEALQRAGATIEQIRDIRARDRRAQGITEEDEKAGLEAAQRSEQWFDGRLTVARLGHEKPVAVADALDARLGGPGFQNLLVCCPHQTLFYGSGRCIEALRKHYPGGWDGGDQPRRGYWGLARPLSDSSVLDTLKVALMSKPASEIVVNAFHHVLIWPLLMRGPSDSEPGARQSIQDFVRALEDDRWKEPARPSETPPRVDGDYTYEEIVYFHPFVRDFLFGDGQSLAESRALRRFKRDDIKAVKIGISSGNTTSDVTLRVERAEVLLIRPRVFILLVEISNRTVDGKGQIEPEIGDERSRLTLEMVLRLQSQVRHIYPPYFRDGVHHGDVPKSVEWVGLPSPPGKCTLDSPRGEFEDFVRAGAEPPVYAHWRVFFGKDVRPLKRAADRSGGGLFLQQMVDDRIPSMSLIAVNDPTEIHPDDADRFPAFDPPELDYDPEFRDRLRDEFRYLRFRHWGTTYYCNGTSFALVCNTESFTNHLIKHFRRHYTHLGLIAHFQHAALIYFADELADTAKDLAERASKADPSDPSWRDRIRSLQSRFLEFRTRSYFTEVSNQIQGKDLFRFWTARLGTAALFDRVSDTNSELYEALENLEMKELAKAQTKLAEESHKLTLAQNKIGWEQKRLAEIAFWGLGLSIFLTTLSAFFAAATLFSPISTPCARLCVILALGLAAIPPAILRYVYRKGLKNS